MCFNRGMILGHLNAHSHFSLLEGLPSPRELVDEAVRQEMPVLALTDHRMLTGAVEFYLACRKAGVQPILGLEVELAWGDGRWRVSLLASGPNGWSNLCQVSSLVNLAGDSAPATQEMLAAHNHDLIAIASDLGDPSGRRLSQLKEIFTDRLYVALPGPHYPLAELAEQLALPVVAAPPVFYLRAEQAAQQRLVSAIRLVTTLKALPGSATAPPRAYFLIR